jgi:hypothetical protein
MVAAKSKAKITKAKATKAARPRKPAKVASHSTVLKKLVLACDGKVKASKGEVMGEEGYVFFEDERMKYAITLGEKRTTLHAVPMYCVPAIKGKFEKKIAGNFGKGCIRFAPGAELDTKVLEAFLKECAKVDWTLTRR